jgi:hypothetical protein
VSTGNDEGLIRFLQQRSGYSPIGDTRDRSAAAGAFDPRAAGLAN